MLLLTRLAPLGAPAREASARPRGASSALKSVRDVLTPICYTS